MLQRARDAAARASERGRAVDRRGNRRHHRGRLLAKRRLRTCSRAVPAVAFRARTDARGKRGAGPCPPARARRDAQSVYRLSRQRRHAGRAAFAGRNARGAGSRREPDDGFGRFLLRRGDGGWKRRVSAVSRRYDVAAGQRLPPELSGRERHPLHRPAHERGFRVQHEGAAHRRNEPRAALQASGILLVSAAAELHARRSAPVRIRPQCRRFLRNAARRAVSGAQARRAAEGNRRFSRIRHDGLLPPRVRG